MIVLSQEIDAPGSSDDFSKSPESTSSVSGQYGPHSVYLIITAIPMQPAYSTNDQVLTLLNVRAGSYKTLVCFVWAKLLGKFCCLVLVLGQIKSLTSISRNKLKWLKKEMIPIVKKMNQVQHFKMIHSKKS